MPGGSAIADVILLLTSLPARNLILTLPIMYVEYKLATGLPMQHRVRTPSTWRCFKLMFQDCSSSVHMDLLGVFLIVVRTFHSLVSAYS